jgi:hypothetical protein
MTWVRVAGALGVIMTIFVTGGLFLRRLLGELADLRGQLTEQRRQITGIDRQMRAQRAHVNFIRQLLAEDDDSEPPPQAAVAGASDPSPSSVAGPHGPEAFQPVRRKRHLGLYLGGAVAALGTVSNAARLCARVHRGALVSALSAATISVATMTAVTVQPWTGSVGHRPPSSQPTVGVAHPHRSPGVLPQRHAALPTVRPSPTAGTLRTLSGSAGAPSRPAVSPSPVAVLSWTPIDRTSPAPDPPASTSAAASSASEDSAGSPPPAGAGTRASPAASAAPSVSSAPGPQNAPGTASDGTCPAGAPAPEGQADNCGRGG